jgi:hypothetical protein
MWPTAKASTRFTARSRRRAGRSPRRRLAADGGGYGFGCLDPDGRNLAFVCACADHADAQDMPTGRARSPTSISTP